MTEKGLKNAYEKRYDEALFPFVPRLEKHIQEIVGGFTRIERIDNISVRAKEVPSFLEKANRVEKGEKKYSDPLNQIQDQLGARIVTFYNPDLKPLTDLILRYLAPIEIQTIVPDTEKEFDYEGIHYIMLIPRDLLTPDFPKELLPGFFELQVKTLFQHAWAQSAHGISYKPESKLTNEQSRKVSFTAAQAWGADMIFGELLDELIKSDD